MRSSAVSSPTGPACRQNRPVSATTPSPRLPRVRASELVGRGWLNTGGVDVTLADLRGKIVVLDFWTFCCVNCLHVLDELRELEEAHRDEVVIVGVHSPKFVHEADPVALAAAVDRYEVRHPVLDDPDLVTWSAYTARAWPTLVVIDPEGYVVAHMAGEGHASTLEILVRELVDEHTAKGTLHRGSGPYVPAEPTPGTLRFPAAVIALESGNLLVADAGHHSLAELAADGETLVRRIGSGERGLADGGPDAATFSEPNGLCLVPEALREQVGYDVLVADTVNHALRGVRLSDGHVTTVAGTGEQLMVGGSENVLPESSAPGTTPALRHRLTSPWDVVWSERLDAFLVAMAGNHSLWTFDPVAGTVEQVAGTQNEGLLDGPLAQAWFAQPSGLSVAPDGSVWLADAETSALRRVDVADDRSATITSLVGQGLFDFGHRDGPAAQALLQHPLGVAALPDGSVLVTDTYNGALRRYDPATDEVTTLVGDLAEPSDALVQVDGDEVHVLVVESTAHRLTRVALPASLAGQVLDSGAHRTQRPVTEVPPGEIRLDVIFTPATGQKYDDRFGPSTQLTVSSTPPELLLDGAGRDLPLVRTLRINPEIAEGVLHVTAQAASCDADPAVEYPACHLAQQDWGVPVRVVAGTPDVLTLPLRG
ncbi:NHL domain-containing thioredoxin family protein [Sanguibacter sp. 4.1]|uniref:NHL domain-containing thioredoxin family protein n=1 Tax=Sanguibacter biliveldensis TaxID=3030830 RepID=A0AAF0Z2P7_9MICO|nr:NHL domain-containing thioredoxin family protein [Sanguibacter sp. 4.1]WPF82135.1 NHL domain-containing thioredoxin family protein [Sanguibacter sp. 4.1]